MKTISALIAVSLLFVAVAAAEGPVTLSTCEKYLMEMKIKPEKKQGDRMLFKLGFSDGKEYPVLLVADAKNKFVYMSVLDLYKMKADDPKAGEMAKKMLELNYGMVLTKLEWDSKEGEVRLSTALTTEDGLSKKRFSASLITLISTAEQVKAKLK